MATVGLSWVATCSLRGDTSFHQVSSTPCYLVALVGLWICYPQGQSSKRPKEEIIYHSFKCAHLASNDGLRLILYPSAQRMTIRSVFILAKDSYMPSGEFYTAYQNKSGIQRKSWDGDYSKDLRFELCRGNCFSFPPHCFPSVLLTWTIIFRMFLYQRP